MKPLLPKNYFFGYLFVRLAKSIAILIFLLGCAFVLFRWAQASNAAGSVEYRSSVGLDQLLDRLAATYQGSARIIAAFNPSTDRSKFDLPRFPHGLNANRDFERINLQLGRVDQDRARMKQLVMERFDSAVGRIESRLRSYADSLRAAPPPASTAEPSPSPGEAASNPSPTPPRREQETLFTKGMGNREIEVRSQSLDEAKEFLTLLESKAESPESQRTLFESIGEIEALRKLLPARAELVTRLPSESPQSSPRAARQSEPQETRTPAKAEEVADKLAAYSQSVREAILSSWDLDSAFEFASADASTEANRCAAATLVVNGIWLAAYGQMALAIIAAALVAFLILVMADLTQTLLDTATNTGIMADATCSKE